MDNFISLRILDLFKVFFTRLGVDYDRLRSILEIKLIMDRRRIPSVLSNSNLHEDKNYFLRSLGIYALHGLILIPFLLFGSSDFIQMSLVYGVLFFLLITTMIADFSSVMLDINDRHILHSKPINHRTISAAKTLHMMIYLFMIIVALTAIPLVFMLVSRGVFYAMVFIFEMVAMSIFLVVFTAVIYFSILRFFDGERLKDLINYVQIILSVALFVGFQVLVRLFDLSSFEFLYEFHWWHLFIPPLWFASPFELIFLEKTTWPIILFSLMSLILPMISLLVYIKMMPAFERYLEKMRDVSIVKKEGFAWVEEFWANALCRSKEEKVFFRFSSMMISREREFRLKVYPGLGIALFLPFLFMFNEYRSSSFAELRNSNFFMSIYLCGLMLATSIQMLKYSNHYKGAWIYSLSSGAEKLGYSAALKAVLLRLYFPIYLSLSIIYIWIFSVRILPDLIAVLLGHVISSLIIYKSLDDAKYPFSVPFNTVQDGNSIKMFFITLIPGLFYILHLLFQAVSTGIYIYLAVLALTLFLLWRRLFRVEPPVI